MNKSGAREGNAGDGRRRSAFTLLELLVCLAVLAILMGLSFPVYSRIVTVGQIAASTSNLTQLAAANMAYAADNEGYFCPAQDRRNLVRWHGARSSTSSPFDPGKGFLAKYLGSEGRVKTCPLFTHFLKGTQSFEDGSGGYGYNSAYIGGTPKDTFTSALISHVPHASRTVMFATTAYAVADGVQEYPFCEPPFWDFGNGPSGSRPSPSVHFRANGRALVAWCDGHVSAEPKMDRPVGDNPNGGDAESQNLGWFGPDADNGYWNPQSAQ